MNNWLHPLLIAELRFEPLVQVYRSEWVAELVAALVGRGLRPLMSDALSGVHVFQDPAADSSTAPARRVELTLEHCVLGMAQPAGAGLLYNALTDLWEGIALVRNAAKATRLGVRGFWFMDLPQEAYRQRMQRVVQLVGFFQQGSLDWVRVSLGAAPSTGLLVAYATLNTQLLQVTPQWARLVPLPATHGLLLDADTYWERSLGSLEDLLNTHSRVVTQCQEALGHAD
ncbi:MAG: hypothetical protein K6U87_13420 [Firmicutes bacterium]|nr:hypothetical protein [Bacillota bacterium]